jgi:hypothetical protein
MVRVVDANAGSTRCIDFVFGGSGVTVDAQRVHELVAVCVSG